MAMEDGTEPRQRRNRKSSKLRYFYLNGDLHKILSVNRAQDFVVCWNFPEGKRVGYVWSDVKKRHGKAFRTSEVAKMVGRDLTTVKRDILNGNIKRPQKIYSLHTKRPGAYYWSEEDVMEMHDYLLSIHIGRPRLDGLIVPRSSIPTKAELRAMMRHDIITYVKTDNEEFIPIWKERDW